VDAGGMMSPAAAICGMSVGGAKVTIGVVVCVGGIV
jgi:hypothetical protein